MKHFINYARLVLLITLTSIMNTSCNPGKTDEESNEAIIPGPFEKLYGNWLCSNLLDSISSRKFEISIFDSLTLPYAYEMQFDESFGDSVLIYNGFEQYFLPVAIHQDSVILYNAIHGDPLVLLYDSVSSTLKITITRHDNYPLPLIYFRANEKLIQPNGRFKEAFRSAFNDITLAGVYSLINNNQSDLSAKVIFKKDGIIEGLDNVIRFTSCIGGDCLGMMQKPMNILSFIKKNEPEEYWTWQLNNINNLLTLTKIQSSNSDEPGNHQITDIHMVFKKIQ